MISLLLCVIFCLCYVWWRSRKGIGAPKLPPKYPGDLPLIGHAYLFMGDSTKLWERIKDGISECIKNGGLIHFYIGPELYYAITDPDDILKVSNTCLQKHFAYTFAKSWLGDGLITGSGETWKRHRRLLSPAFNVSVVHSFLDVFNGQAKQMVEDMAHHVNKGTFIHTQYVKKMALETFCMTAFGIDSIKTTNLEKYSGAVDESLSIIIRRLQSFWLHSDLVYQFSGLKRRADEVINIMNTISDDVIQQKKALLKNGYLHPVDETKVARHKPLLDLMLELSAEDSLTEKEMKEEVDSTITAGSDTLSNLLTCLISLMGQYPEIQEKMYDEIIRVLGTERDIMKEDLPELVYTEAVIKETLRFMPTAPLILRYIDKEVQLKNYTLRAGSQCVLFLAGAMMDPSWGDDAKEYRPERWLEPASVPDNPSAFAAFSLGKRNCMGKTYSYTLLKVTLAHFFRSYRVTSDLSNLKMKMSFVLKPKSGHEITLERRC